MKCHICDRDLNEKEVSYNDDIGSFEPCTVCLEIAFDAAFSDGFCRPDEDDAYVIIEDEDTVPLSYSSVLGTMMNTFRRRDDDEVQDFRD